jgi:recombination protein RecR
MNSLEHFNTLIEAFESLPTIGKKSAKNLALYLIKEDKYSAIKLAHAIEEAINKTRFCTQCGFLSEHELCDICANGERDFSQLTIVSSIKDILTIESAGMYQGRYFVFESIENVELHHLYTMIEQGVKEIIFAFPPSLANDALIYYIEEHLKTYTLSFSKIAQGVPTGVHLENVDTLSLMRALESRTLI